MRVGSKTFLCEKCKGIIDREDRITVKSYKTIKGDNYYTTETSYDTIHFHEKCYWEVIHSF